MRTCSILLLALASGAWAPAARAADDAPDANAAAAERRYLAVFADGSQAAGNQLSDWAQMPASPKLDGVELLGPQRPLRWLLDRTLAPLEPAGDARGFVEMINGDRLPGRIVGYDEGTLGGLWGQWPCLRVEVDVGGPVQQPYVRVLPQFVRRIVFGRSSVREYEPGTVFYADGRRIFYRAFRWDGEALKLLTSDGIREVAVRDLAEVHLPASDAWDAFCDELALLSPDLSSRLVRLESSQGAVVTGSESRCCAWAPQVPVPRKQGEPAPPPETPPATQLDPDPVRWQHGVQPAWSLDPVWMPFASIRSRWYFAPTEIPLSRLEPARVVQRTILAAGWPWQADRNVRGGPLESGGRPFAWGFGVQTPNELWFDLPEYVQGFRTRAGLDRLVRSRGCARAAVYLNQAGGRPLYRSKPLAGSGEVVDTGMLPLAGPAAGQKSLVLAAEPAGKDRPRGADPLDIRGVFDWLEPTLHLQTARLQLEIQKHVPGMIPAWHGWAVKVEGDGALRVENRAENFDRKGLGYFLNVGTAGRPLVLSAQRQIGPKDNWLVVRLRSIAEGAAPGQIEVRIDDRPIARFPVPPVGLATPALVPLKDFQGRSAQLALVYTPADAREQVEWHTLAMAESPAKVRWTPLRPTAVRSLNGSTLTVQEDASVLASGTLPANDIYTVICEAEMPGITAFRLETIPDESLPGKAAGRGPKGEFILTRFTVAEAPREPKAIEGRYVRIELPSPQKHALMLAEVQVFSGGKNVAPGGIATQHSTADGGEAKRAIDGNTDGKPADGSVSQTKGIREYRLENKDLPSDTPWWEVDLREVKPIERIVIWNRSDTNLFFLKDYQVTVLDAARNPVWQRWVNESPVLADELDVLQSTSIPLRAGDADIESPRYLLAHSLRCPYLELQGWGFDSHLRSPHVGVYAVGSVADAAGQPGEETAAKGPQKVQLIFKLKHCNLQRAQCLLGRFRISATTDKPPWPAEPVGVEVPLLSE